MTKGPKRRRFDRDLFDRAISVRTKAKAVKRARQMKRRIGPRDVRTRVVKVKGGYEVYYRLAR